ncbi:MAG: hypothetical protein Q9196_005108 [Gyalolechia fulgens]
MAATGRRFASRESYILEDLELLHGPGAETNQLQTGTGDSGQIERVELLEPPKDDIVKPTEHVYGSSPSSPQSASFIHDHAQSRPEHQAAEHPPRHPSSTPSIEITRTRTRRRARKRKLALPRKKSTASEHVLPDTAGHSLSPTSSHSRDLIREKYSSLADAPPLSAGEQSPPPKPRQRPTAADFFTHPYTPEDGEILPVPHSFTAIDIERLIDEEKLAALRNQATQAGVDQSQLPSPPPTAPPPTISFRIPSSTAPAKPEIPGTAGRKAGEAPSGRSTARNSPRTRNQSMAAESGNQLVINDQLVEALRTRVSLPKKPTRFVQSDRYRPRYGVTKDRKR